MVVRALMPAATHGRLIGDAEIQIIVSQVEFGPLLLLDLLSQFDSGNTGDSEQLFKLVVLHGGGVIPQLIHEVSLRHGLEPFEVRSLSLSVLLRGELPGGTDSPSTCTISLEDGGAWSSVLLHRSEGRSARNQRDQANNSGDHGFGISVCDYLSLDLQYNLAECMCTSYSRLWRYGEEV